MTTNGGRRAGWRGFGVAGALPHDVIRTLAAAAEAAGYHTFWVNDTPQWRRAGRAARRGGGDLADPARRGGHPARSAASGRDCTTRRRARSAPTAADRRHRLGKPPRRASTGRKRARRRWRAARGADRRRCARSEHVCPGGEQFGRGALELADGGVRRTVGGNRHRGGAGRGSPPAVDPSATCARSLAPGRARSSPRRRVATAAIPPTRPTSRAWGPRRKQRRSSATPRQRFKPGWPRSPASWTKRWSARSPARRAPTRIWRCWKPPRRSEGKFGLGRW